MNTFNFYHIITELQQAHSIVEIEQIATRTLKRQLNLESVKIQLMPSMSDGLSFVENTELQSYVFTDKLQILFLKDKKFSLKEKKYLDKVGKKIIICCDKLIQLERSEHLKHQWDSTFNSISTPICLTDESFNITKSNTLFSNSINMSGPELVGKNVFKTFFGTKNISFKAGKEDNHFSALVQKGVKTFDVQCQLITHKNTSTLFRPKKYLIVFRDITENSKLEKKIFESAKLAELGTIGSSIAHELNNPLAGILAFVQLIKNDLPDDSLFAEDINEMEQAGLKCKSIVENLLGFSRKTATNEINSINLISVLKSCKEQAQKVIGDNDIKIQLSSTHDDVKVTGNKNLLTQALQNIVNNAISHYLNNIQSSRQQLVIKIDFRESTDRSKGIITISDNREVSDKYNPFNNLNNLELTVAYKILKDHSFNIDFSSQPKMGVEAKLSFQRLDLLDERQVFDTKI